jgi:small-conductance mechanosensitive channel
MPELSWATVVKWLIDHGISILIIVVVGAVLWFALNKLLPPVVRRAVARTKDKDSEEAMEKRTNTLLSIFKGIVRVFIVIVVIMMILPELGVDIVPLVAGLGIAGFALGFGAQYLIRDLIAGIFIVLENQYRVGDVVRVADIGGLVEEITLRKTVLRDLDGIVHHVPNGEIKTASNFTRRFARVNLNISVAYDTDLDHAISVINRIGQELAKDEKWREKIISPPKVERVDNLGDSGIDIKILGDVKPIQQWAVMGELRLRLKKTFDAEGIEIPWPHTKVYFGNPLPDSPKKKD